MGAGTALAVLALTADYRRWSAAEDRRLRQGSHIVTTKAGDVEYIEEGDGLPVLMLHGSPGGYDSGLFLGKMLRLPGCRVIAPSRPGYLRTPASSGRTPQAQANLMVALLDTLGVERAAVIGVSGGGPCALAMAQHHPDRCTHLVMIEAVSDSYSEASMYAALPPLARVGKWISTAAMKSNVSAYLARALGRVEESGLVTEFAQSFARYDRRRCGCELDMEQFEHLGRMSTDRVTMPTLIVHGSADTDLPVAKARELADRIPHARLQVEEGLDHLTLWTSPGWRADVMSLLGLESPAQPR